MILYLRFYFPLENFMKCNALHRSNYYYMCSHKQFLHTAGRQSLRLPQWWQAFPAAIGGQGGCSPPQTHSNKHLPENSTNPQDWQVLKCPNPTCVNNYTIVGSHAALKPTGANETAINHKYMYFFNCFHLLLHTHSAFTLNLPRCLCLELLADSSSFQST